VPPDFVPKPFHCDVAQTDGVVRLSPRGELDMSSVPILEEQLRAALDGGGKRLVVDLRGLEFMDSTGLQVLVQLDELAKHDGFDFAVLCGDGLVRRVLRETGLDGILPVVDPAGVVPLSDSPV
jgi:anti-sigma B factor antagonist